MSAPDIRGTYWRAANNDELIKADTLSRLRSFARRKAVDLDRLVLRLAKCEAAELKEERVPRIRAAIFAQANSRTY